ncbi:uncharacterized protein RBU57_000454 [Macrochelys suwanniensis]
MQSSSAEVTMQSQNRKRAPAWTEREVLDLIAVWGDESVLSELRSKRRNAKMYEKIAKAMTDRGYTGDAMQCHVKIKELRQAYQKTKESNGRSGSDPQTCRFYAVLHAILGGAATTTPPLSVDSEDGVFSSVASSDVFADGEDDEGDDEDEVVDSALQGNFPESQELFLTLTEIPSQGSIPDREAGEGTSAATVPMLPPASPFQRLSQIRRRKKCTRDEMFSELMLCSRTEVAQQNLQNLLVDLFLGLAKMAIHSSWRSKRMGKIRCNCGAYFHFLVRSRLQAEFLCMVSTDSFGAFEEQWVPSRILCLMAPSGSLIFNR